MSNTWRNRSFQEEKILTFYICGKLIGAKLPILSRMARDILPVPTTTIASESAFSICGRVIDENRASLLPDIVEALVTIDDWIESTRKKSSKLMILC